MKVSKRESYRVSHLDYSRVEVAADLSAYFIDNSG